MEVSCGALIHFWRAKYHLYPFSNNSLENVNTIIVTWSTVSKTDASVVQYGTKDTDLVATGSSKLFTDGGRKKRSQYIHRVCVCVAAKFSVAKELCNHESHWKFLLQVTLSNLLPLQTYSYRCGSDEGWSRVFTFKSAAANSDWAPELAIFGDLGVENAQSLPRLQQELHRYDAIIHNGDFAYDMDSQNGKVGDQFMRDLESIAATVPYMVCAGNHEEK